MMKLWIVTAVDYDRDGNCNGKARVLGAFKSYGEAEDYVNKDMNEWAERNNGDECGCDFGIMSAWCDSDYSAGCEWNIEEVEIPK